MEPTGNILDYPVGHFLTRTVIKSSAQIIGMEIHCNNTTSLQGDFLNAPPNFSTKNELQPIRAAFQEKAPYWLSMFFHVSTENWEEQLKSS